MVFHNLFIICWLRSFIVRLFTSLRHAFGRSLVVHPPFVRLTPVSLHSTEPTACKESSEWTEWGARMTRLTTGDERNELWGEESFNRPSSISALLLSSSPFLAATGPSPLVSVCRRSPTLHSSPRPKGSARCAAKEASMTWGGMSRDRRGAGPSFACHHHPWSGLVRSFHSLPILWPLLMIERLGSDESGPDMTDHGGSNLSSDPHPRFSRSFRNPRLSVASFNRSSLRVSLYLSSPYSRIRREA